MMPDRHSGFFGLPVLVIAWVLCAATFLLCLRFGNADASLGELLGQGDGFLYGRFARALCALAVGGALAAAGVLLQTLTGNPLADPGITGINAGAALGAILCAWLWHDAGMGVTILAAVAGASLAGGGLWLLIGADALGGQDGIALRLPLAGLAIEALCLTLTSSVILTDTTMQSRYLHWLAGAMPVSLEGEGWALIAMTVAAVAGALLCGRLALLTLGGDQSQMLGRDPRMTVRLVLAVVILLSAASVAVAGPIAFIGLVVPFVTRRLLPQSLLLAYGLAIPAGGILLMLGDLAGRALLPPLEFDAGMIVALVGGPCLIVILGRLLGRGVAGEGA